MDSGMSAEIAMKRCVKYRERLDETNLIDFYRSVHMLYLIIKKEYFKSYMDNEEFWNFVDVLRDLSKNHTWEYDDEEDWHDAQDAVEQCEDYIKQLDAKRSSIS